MPELEQRLRALSAAIAYPETPDLAAGVERRLAEAARPWRRWGLRLAVVLAVLVAALGAVLTISPGARSAFLEWLGIRGAVVLRLEELPPVTPATSLEQLGDRVTREEARRRAGFELVELHGLGEPDGVYFKEPGLVSFLYGSALDVRLIFSQVSGTVTPAFLKKIAGTGTRVEELRVAGAPALFISGEPHFFTYVAGDGSQQEEAVYLARDVLLWERGSLTLRLEGELTRAQALELADTVR